MTDEGLTDPGALGAGMTDGTILKILSGVQSGVEVSLSSGQYTLGSSGDDDIQIIDVSLAPGHLQLRVGAGAIQIRAAAGSVRTGNGIDLEPDSDWHEVEPLDILTAGTTRLALGPSTAAWTSVTDIEDVEAPSEKEEVAPKHPSSFDFLAHIDLRKQALPLLALVMVLGLAIWYLASDGAGRSGGAGATPANVAEVRAALVPLPFARNIDVRQEVDGTIYATGYVESTVERRAVSGAIEETGVPVHLRVWVLESMRQEIEGLIEAQKRKVTFAISPTGVVTLNGLIPDDDQAEQFISTIREGVLGVTSVESNLRTPTSLLAEVEKLAQSSRIKPWVLFRFDQGVIEATGALPADEKDSWSGFLQVYARRFAPDVGLRSFVQLQDINVQGGNSAPPVNAITIGAPAQNSGDVEVDVSRIQQGNFTSDDVLIGAAQSRPSISMPSQQQPGQPSQPGADGGQQVPSSSLPPSFPSPGVRGTGSSSASAMQVVPDGGGSLIPGNSFPVSVQIGLDTPTFGSANIPESSLGRPSEAAVPARISLSTLPAQGQAQAPARQTAGMQVLAVAPATQRQAEAVRAVITTKDAPPGAIPVTRMETLAVRPAAQGRLANPVRAVTRVAPLPPGKTAITDGMAAVLGVTRSGGLAEPVQAAVRMGQVPAAGTRDTPAEIGMRALPVMPPREKMAAPITAKISVSPDEPVQLAQLPQVVGMRALSVPPAEEGRNANVAAAVGLGSDPIWYGIEGFNVPPITSNLADVDNEVPSNEGVVASGGEVAPKGETSPNASLSDSTRLLLEQWRDGRLQGGANANSLMQALERLSKEGGGTGAPSRLARQQLHDRYLPAASGRVASRDVCWPASQLTPQDAATALFWLDILSVGRTLSLSSFDADNQLALMEVAMNPRRVTRCIERAFPDTDITKNSVFLREVKNNPAFIRFILRDISPFSLDVAGASPAGEARFIQTRDGVKIREGASPNDSSRLLVVGELGAVVEVPRGLASLIYGPNLVWMLD